MLSGAVAWEIYDRTGSAFLVGLVGLVQVVPVVGLALVIGPLVDRSDRRTLLRAAQLLLGAVGLLLAAGSQLQLPLGAMYGALLLFGVGTALNAPSSSALVPQLVPRASLARANALLSTVFQTAAVLGPVAAGQLIALRGAPTSVYLIEATGCLAFALLLSTLPSASAPPAAPATAHGRLEGLRFILASPLLLPALTLDLFAVLLGGTTALLPVFAKELLAVGPRELGWLQAAPAVGAAVMALAQTRLAPWQRPGRVLLTVVAGFGLATIGFGLSRSLALSIALLALAGLLDNISAVLRSTLEQVVTPDALRGRVSSIHYVFIGLSNELGAFESGVAAALLGPVGAVLFGGVGTLAVVALIATRAPALLQLGPLDAIRPQPPPSSPPEQGD
jgi:MFS family permease